MLQHQHHHLLHHLHLSLRPLALTLLAASHLHHHSMPSTGQELPSQQQQQRDLPRPRQPQTMGASLLTHHHHHLQAQRATLRASPATCKTRPFKMTLTLRLHGGRVQMTPTQLVQAPYRVRLNLLLQVQPPLLTRIALRACLPLFPTWVHCQHCEIEHETTSSA